MEYDLDLKTFKSGYFSYIYHKALWFIITCPTSFIAGVVILILSLLYEKRVLSIGIMFMALGLFIAIYFIYNRLKEGKKFALLYESISKEGHAVFYIDLNNDRLTIINKTLNIDHSKKVSDLSFIKTYKTAHVLFFNGKQSLVVTRSKESDTLIESLLRKIRNVEPTKNY